MPPSLAVELGVKSDPIEYRYSHRWLFRLMRDEGVRNLQLGTFFELYRLPVDELRALRDLAADHDVSISSVFTAHRELGGFFRTEAGYESVARQAFEQLIRAGAVLGARWVGSNPGAAMRDEMTSKADGMRRYLAHAKELMAFACDLGLEGLTLEPMSCLAEPPTLPDEIAAMAGALVRHHEAHPESTCEFGVCADVSHGYADADGRVVHPHTELFEACFPYLREIHLKNTDARYHRTFGFGPSEIGRGIVDLSDLRDRLDSAAGALPTDRIVAYLEIGGPKLGRDDTDRHLERELRESIAYCREQFRTETAPVPGEPVAARPVPAGPTRVRLAPSLACADPMRLGEEVAELEALGADMLHVDIMDGRFVADVAFGLEVPARLREATRLPLDVHLMVEDSEFFIDRLLPLGVRRITVHVESVPDPAAALRRIRSRGVLAGIALKPDTPLARLDLLRGAFDFVLLMTVFPGSAGRPLAPGAIERIAEARATLREPISVDGNVSLEDIPKVVAAG
ncbi:MAG: TIM barrel protein, partial [Fimbriimonadaceae bacterium]